MSTNEELRKEFEAMCRFMRVKFSLEWDEEGFYLQLATNRSYTWFKLGFDQAEKNNVAPAVMSIERVSIERVFDGLQRAKDALVLTLEEAQGEFRSSEIKSLEKLAGETERLRSKLASRYFGANHGR